MSSSRSRSRSQASRRVGGSSRAAPASRRVECHVARSAEEVAAHFAVRHAVFVEEQGLFEGSDRDEHDEGAIHIVAMFRERGASELAVVGAVRCYEEEPGIWFGGRLAVLDAYRRRGGAIGSALVRRAEEAMVEREVEHFLAYIQTQNVRFFQRLGWWTVGEPMDLCGAPHQVMEASLGRPRPRRTLGLEDFRCLRHAEADARRPG